MVQYGEIAEHYRCYRWHLTIPKDISDYKQDKTVACSFSPKIGLELIRVSQYPRYRKTSALRPGYMFITLKGERNS